jgi:retinol dehydrogenase 14
MATSESPLRDRTIFVTGSTDGIGRETARQLGELGARLLVHGRDAERVEAVVAQLQAQDVSTEGFVADFASLREVRRLATEVAEAVPRLDVLINNAGLYLEERQLSQDGYEMTFAVNHLAPFLLTNLLLPLLSAAPAARIINVSSGTHRSGYLDWADLQGEEAYDGYQAYALSKLCNVLFTFELAERLAGRPITVNCLHPGVVDTKLLHAGIPGSRGADVREGARTPVYLAASSTLESVTATYFSERRPQRPAGIVYDTRIRRHLWDISTRLVGLEEEEAA